MLLFKRLGIGISIFTLTAMGLAGCATKGSPQLAGGGGPSPVNQTANGTTGSVAQTSSRAANAASNGVSGAAGGATNTASSNSVSSLNGTQNSASAGNSSAGATTTVHPSNGLAPQFPSIVNMAMAHFPSSVLVAPEAPTVLPQAKSGSRQLYYRTWDTTTGPILNYNVQFSSPSQRLATFSGSTFTGISAGSSVWLPYAAPTNGQTTHSTVKLSDGIVASEQTFIAPKNSAKEVSAASLKWSEGRWQIEVSQTQSTQVPLAQADAVAAYLHSHFMPVPQSKGSIFVNVYPGMNAQGQATGSSVSETIKWQEGQHVYEVDTYSQVQNPIQTGLAMAISMKPYPASNQPTAAGTMFDVTSPTRYESVRPGQSVSVSGRVSSGFYHDMMSVQLFSGVTHGSALLEQTKIQIGSAGEFHGTVTIPSEIHSGTELSLVLEALVHGGPMQEIHLVVS